MRFHSSLYVAGHIKRIMWRPTICGARATIVSVEYRSGLLTPHILAWMIAVHHHGWRTDHARRTFRTAGRCHSLSRRALRGFPRAIPAAGARGRLLAGNAGKYGLGIACCSAGSSRRRRERILRAAQEYTSSARTAQIDDPPAVRKHGQALSSLRESMAAQHRCIDPGSSTAAEVCRGAARLHRVYAGRAGSLSDDDRRSRRADTLVLCVIAVSSAIA
jgi:hypothetical protein